MNDRYLAVDTTPVGEHYRFGGGSPKHMAITSKGVVWVGRTIGGASHHWYLYAINPLGDPVAQPGDANGAIADTSNWLIGAMDWSMVIDEKDNIHLVYARYTGTNDGHSYSAAIGYKHGVITGPSSITWSAEVTLTGGDYWQCPDIVAHYLPETNQVYAHIFWNYNWAGDHRNIIAYARVRSNSGDAVNHVLEQGVTYLHDNTNSQVFAGKLSCELRHAGDGKTVYRDANGAPKPDIFVTYTMGSQSWTARIAYTGSGGTASWANPYSERWMINPDWANNTANYLIAGNDGKFEHHRWHKTLYDPRDDRVIYIGWLGTGYTAVTRQALLIWEWTPGMTSAIFGHTFGSSATGVILDWGINTLDNCVSGAACLNPVDSNIEIFSNVGEPWYDKVGRRQILRPKGSNTRTATAYELLHGGGGTDGAKADILPYPPSGENHCTTFHPNTWFHYWRNNRGCRYVHNGSAVVRRPVYRMHADGTSLVPVTKLRR